MTFTFHFMYSEKMKPFQTFDKKNGKEKKKEKAIMKEKSILSGPLLQNIQYLHVGTVYLKPEW